MSIAILLGLITVTVLWLLLPLIPALCEFMAPTDTAPLTVVSRDSSDIAFFSKSFRNYLLPLAEKFDFTTLRDSEPAILSDGTPFVRVQGVAQLPFVQHPLEKTVDHLVIAGDGAILPDRVTFQREIFGVKSLIGGSDCTFRAILAEGNLTLHDRSIVLRWAHSVGVFEVHEGTALYGRASSDEALHLALGTSFEWIAAPVISVGKTQVSPVEAGQDIQRSPRKLDDMIAMTDDTYRFDGDLVVSERSIVTGNLVVTGKVTIESNSHIRGSLKAHEMVTLGEGCLIDGSIITMASICVGRKCTIGGQLIAEEEISVGHGSLIGSREKPVTVSAPHVTLCAGVVVSGMVVAQGAGKTMA